MFVETSPDQPLYVFGTLYWPTGANDPHHFPILAYKGTAGSLNLKHKA